MRSDEDLDILIKKFQQVFDCAFAIGYEKGKEERPTGEWINTYWEDAYQQCFHTCSICKKEIVKTAYDNYCSCCGAKMRKGEK